MSRMSLLQSAPSLTAAEAVRLAHDLYGLNGTAQRLPSERDQNFVIETDSARFVLKIANKTESRSILEAQNAALAHLASRVPFCPRVVPSASGGDINDAPSGHFVRLVTWLPGIPLGSLSHHPPALLADLGRCAGELDKALLDFDHPALHREFHWDLARAVEIVSAALPALPDAELRRALEDVNHVAGRLLPRANNLRRSIVHNDANDYNVLVSGAPGTADLRVSGLIDFGDMVHTFTIADLAVATAYALLGKPDPLSAAVHVVRAYHAVYPITADEVSVLFDLAKLRLYLSVVHAADQQRQRPGDDYLTISQAPIRSTLPRLSAVDSEGAAAALRAACGFDGPHLSKAAGTR
jgi:Ser/Thr protein kinase RdoA (MazF antagonist)